MILKIGDRIPPGLLKELNSDGPRAIPTSEVFDGKTVVLFSCPGAFTPKSTQRHVPSYLQHALEFFRLGADSIACISVNDAFVMRAWGEACGVNDTIRMLADGHAEFHTSMGLEMDCTRFTLGIRSHRFSLLATDGVVELLNIEEPGAYEVSDASVIAKQMAARSG